MNYLVICNTSFDPEKHRLLFEVSVHNVLSIVSDLEIAQPLCTKCNLQNHFVL